MRPKPHSEFGRYGGATTRSSKNCSMICRSSRVHGNGFESGKFGGICEIFICNDCIWLGFKYTWHCRPSTLNIMMPGWSHLMDVNCVWTMLISILWYVIYIDMDVITQSSDWMKRCRLRRIYPHPRNRSSGLSSEPNMSLCGCRLGRQSVSRASSVNSVGTADAQERAGRTRDTWAAMAVKTKGQIIGMC